MADKVRCGGRHMPCVVDLGGFATTEMESVVLAKTASRQVLGVMNEFVFMAEHTISTGRSDPDDLVGMSVWLANTIVGPISRDDGHTPLGALQNRVAEAVGG